MEIINVCIGEGKFVSVANDPSVIPLIKQLESLKVCGTCTNSTILNEPYSPGRLVCTINPELPCEVKKMNSCIDWDLEVKQ